MNQTLPYKTHEIFTQDAWKIFLYQYENKNKKRHPVLLVHGLASNRYNFDFPEKEKSFAQYLWKKGWDVWVIELRGAGKSTKPKALQWLTKKWTFDHYVAQDLPAAVDYILQQSGQKKLHWVGHSMGGLLVYPFIKTQSAHIFQSITTVGSPMTSEIKPAYFKWTSKLDPLFKLIPFLPYRSMAKIVHRYADSIHQLKEPLLFAKENMDPETLKLGSQVAVDDVSAGVILQIHNWMRKNHFKSFDESVDYTLDLKKLEIPIFIITGNQDPFTPASLIKGAFEEIAASKKKWIVFGKKEGYRSNYGHLDLIIGKNAPKEVFPAILDWIETHDS